MTSARVQRLRHYDRANHINAAAKNLKIHVDEQALGFNRPNFSSLTQAELLGEREVEK